MTTTTDTPTHIAALAETLFFLPPPARGPIATTMAGYGARRDTDQATAALVTVGSPQDGNWAARDIRPLTKPTDRRPTVAEAVAQVERMALLTAVLQRSMPPGAPLTTLVPQLDALGVRIHLDQATEKVDGLADLQVLRVLRNAAQLIPELTGIADRAERARALAAKGDRSELEALGEEMRARILANQQTIAAAGDEQAIAKRIADADTDAGTP